MKKQRILISGATGFLGTHLRRRLIAAGAEVAGLAREPGRAAKANPECAWFPYELPHLPSPAAFEPRVDVFIHCAYEPSSARESTSALNVEGTRRLVNECRARGVGRFILISSMSAHEGAESEYGRSKLACESLLDPARDVWVRPGFIIGNGGIFLRLSQMIGRIPAIPLFYGGHQLIHTITVDELTLAIERIIEKELRGLVLVGEAEAVELRDFYAAIARCQGRRPFFVPVPGGPALAGLRATERLGVPLPFTSENLLGLKALRSFDLKKDLAALDLQPRTMAEGLRDYYGR